MKTVIHMIITLTFIGVIAGGLLSIVNGWADPQIRANQKAETERAIFLVNPDGKSYETLDSPQLEIYKVFDDNKSLLGYSIANEGNGFQGKIRMMIGLSADLSTITSIEILDQVETPGLGTKVTEDPFRKQFIGLQTTPMIIWIKGAEPTQPNQIEAITGATISSKAVVAIMNDAVNKARDLKTRGKL